MEENPPELWFCCLHLAEAIVFQATALQLAAVLYVGVPFALWDANWLIGGHNEDRYKAAFLALYHLEIVTIVEDDVEVSVVRPVVGYEPLWVTYTVFALSPASACPDGCGLSKFPWQY